MHIAQFEVEIGYLRNYWHHHFINTVQNTYSFGSTSWNDEWYEHSTLFEECKICEKWVELAHSQQYRESVPTIWRCGNQTKYQQGLWIIHSFWVEGCVAYLWSMHLSKHAPDSLVTCRTTVPSDWPQSACRIVLSKVIEHSSINQHRGLIHYSYKINQKADKMLALCCSSRH